MDKIGILNQMQTYLLEHGWTQREFANSHDGRVCILGALNRCNQIPEVRYSIQRDMNKALNGSVISWNDDSVRTFNDVINFLDDMILREKEKLGSE